MICKLDASRVFCADVSQSDWLRSFPIMQAPSPLQRYIANQIALAAKAVGPSHGNTCSTLTSASLNVRSLHFGTHLCIHPFARIQCMLRQLSSPLICRYQRFVCHNSAWSSRRTLPMVLFEWRLSLSNPLLPSHKHSQLNLQSYLESACVTV